MTSLSSVRPSTRNLAYILALVPALGGSCLAVSKTVPTNPIVVSELREDSSKKDVDSLVQNASPPPSVGGNKVIKDHLAKWARTSVHVEVEPR